MSFNILTLIITTLVLSTSCAPKESLYRSSYDDFREPLGAFTQPPRPKEEKEPEAVAIDDDAYEYHGKDMDVVQQPETMLNYDELEDVCVTIPDGTRKKIGNPYVINGTTYYPIDSAEDFTEEGVASWYGPGFNGKKTANGEVYDQTAMTAAHKTLPIPTLLKVENLENGKQIVVRVNDRGPFSKGRVIDLSEAGAARIGMLKKGTARVKLTVLSEDPNCYAVKGEEIDLDKGDFAVQIGAFIDVNNKDKFVEKVKLEDNYTTEVTVGDVDNLTFNRVRITGYKSKTDARTKADLLGEKFPGSFVIAR